MNSFPPTPHRAQPPLQARLVPTLTEVVTPAVLNNVASPAPSAAALAEAMEKRLLGGLEADLDRRIREAVYAALGMHLPALVAQVHSQVLAAVEQSVRESVGRELARSEVAPKNP